MKSTRSRGARARKYALPVALLAAVVTVITAGTTQAGPTTAKVKGPKFTEAVAFDVSKPLRELAKGRKAPTVNKAALSFGPDGLDFESASSRSASRVAPAAAGAVGAQQAVSSFPSTIANFEGLSNQDNFNVFGFRVNPPDTNGDVGPNHYVEMINLLFAVYDKAGNKLLGPVDTGTLWAGFAVPDCTDPSGDPIVLYDATTDRWILTQFTTRGLDDPALPFYNCVAVSQTGDPTGAYFRYAFITQPDPDGGFFFPDYPKYGVWTDSYVLTTRDFGLIDRYGISVYALEKNKMVNGEPKARAVQFFLDSATTPINLIGDGLLPADIDGKQKPKAGASVPIVGTQDDGGPYGATFDALNIWELSVHWQSTPSASLVLKTQLPTAPFDSIYPCGPPGPPDSGITSRDCLPQPGIAPTANNRLDILSYRQRATWRLAYRNFKNYESLVTNQSVEALPALAGARWYEIRRVGGTYSIHQQGTVAGTDGVHRWMGSIAQDKQGNMALGYSVVDGTSVFPGIRYTGRLAADPLGTMPQGEGTVVNGTGIQRTSNSRWGDYTSMSVDPVDDCTFWYANEYYTLAGQASSTAGWQTRIASFKFPGCS
jgi:hypothetical protein